MQGLGLSTVPIYSSYAGFRVFNSASKPGRILVASAQEVGFVESKVKQRMMIIFDTDVKSYQVF